MAAERKLKGEIDRTLKKVQEGQEEFEALWNQVHSCDSANLREKLEDQLKKEIKKLQRLREQIKGWITNADIKDKQPLLDARKSIEKDMERFKACEREMKMVGRAGMPKPADPKEKAKEEAKEWINAAVDQLQTKVEEMEFEIEELQGNMKKKQKPPARLAELEELTTRHKDHIARLEKVLRCIDNETIEPDEEGIETLKGDMEMYLSDTLEENGLDASNVDAMYDQLADRLEAVDLAVPAAQAAHVHAKLAKGKEKDKEEAEKEKEREREAEKQRAAILNAKAQLVAQGNNNIKLNEEEDGLTRAASLKLPGGKAALPVVVSPVNAPPPATAATAAQPTTPGSAGQQAGGVPAQPPPPPPPMARSPTDKSSLDGLPPGVSPFQQPPATPRGAMYQEPSPVASMGTPVNGSLGGAAPAGAASRPPGFPAAAAAIQAPPAPARGPPPGIVPPGAPAPTPAPPGPSPTAAPPGGAWGENSAAPNGANARAGGNVVTKLAVGVPAAAPTAGMAGAVVGRSVGAPPGMAQPVGAGGAAPGRAPPPGYGAPAGAAAGSMDGSLADGDHARADGAAAADARASLDSAAAATAAAAASLPPMEPPNLSPITPAYNPNAAKQILEACFARFQPQASDTDLRAYRPRHPVPTPLSYPRAPHDVVEHPQLFRKMDPECLFFAFYFQPDTYQQFLAAHELKRQSWRFHKHHTAWFQRFQEPSITNEEYEQGAYVYFDYNIVHDDNQTGWCYRRKENFTFRYDALEDELRTPPAPPAGAVPQAQPQPAQQQQQQAQAGQAL